jgi:hypothetical protein
MRGWLAPGQAPLVTMGRISPDTSLGDYNCMYWDTEMQVR